MPPAAPLLVLDSITLLPLDAAGAVVVAASHGGFYPGFVAGQARLRAVILNDAGFGLDDAGAAALPYLDAIGMPAAVVGHDSARIGDGPDTIANGIVTRVNAHAAGAGCRPGQTCRDAAELLRAANVRLTEAPPLAESRFVLSDGVVKVWGLDSAAMVTPAHRDMVVVTGSHGGLLGGRPATALKVDARAAVYHDAGIGKDSAGTTRLPALDIRGIGAATVAARSARIGDARSIWATGRLSAVNDVARSWGAAVGMDVPAFADLAIARAPAQVPAAS